MTDKIYIDQTMERFLSVLEQHSESLDKLIDFALAHEAHIQRLEQRIELLEGAIFPLQARTV